jgi:DNA-binding NtrC family response regulator
MIGSGRFREDLYYRLNLIEIALPALAGRTEDILPLAEHFLGEHLQLADEARTALLQHGWPGNVRELRNCIERAKLLARDRIVSAADLNLPPAQRTAGRDAAVAGMGDDITQEAIEASLRMVRGNISRAAQILGISRQALYRRMEYFGLRT